MNDLIRSTIFVEKNEQGSSKGRLTIGGYWDFDDAIERFKLYIDYEELEDAEFDLTKCSLTLYSNGCLMDDIGDFNDMVEWNYPTSYYKNKEGYKKDEEIKFSDLDLTEYKNAFDKD